MILIVNLNPAVDRYLTFPRVVPGTVHRSRPVRLQAGGKGINVARMLKNLKCHSEVCGFAGGTTGTLLQQLLHQEGISFHALQTNSETRCCSIAFDETTGEETVWNEPGEAVERQDWVQFKGLFEQLAASASCVILSGSAPPETPLKIFAELTACAHRADCWVLVDIPPVHLDLTLAEHPFLVKPNHLEASAYLGSSLESPSEVIQAALELHRSGAQNVLLTCGKDGAVLATSQEIYQFTCAEFAPGTRIHTTGAGDASMAGFAAGLEKGLSVIEAARFSIACGTTYALYGNQCTPLDVEQVMGQYLFCQQFEV